ncbi:hypothetical protein K3169_03780 [Pseudomonas phytophila]|uniref:Uncharacterized protein n=1 Tax=Pseudomonas phytophila TaxID=2867264 RepID=A0ABY6FGM4_9PSED|nr:hypothetical protein [Pseudomonas phytophila]UXZ97040.1 hypothetical protein K3169_03780 [Pseudomonas phytophila]
MGDPLFHAGNAAILPENGVGHTALCVLWSKALIPEARFSLLTRHQNGFDSSAPLPVAPHA